MGFEKDGDECPGGQVPDPEKSKQYKCYIKPKGKNELEVRGYAGFSLISRLRHGSEYNNILIVIYFNLIYGLCKQDWPCLCYK